jgi:hypothetical protein
LASEPGPSAAENRRSLGGEQDDAESVVAIHAGLERGINWIDTAAVYGLGHSEEVAGRAVRGLSKRLYVFTKCSLAWDESGTISHNLQAASIRKEAEASLKRLGVDVIDLNQIHWPAWKGNSESASPGSIEEAVGELAKLQAEGKIRNIGVSNFNAQQMARSRGCAHNFASATVFAAGHRSRARDVLNPIDLFLNRLDLLLGGTRNTCPYTGQIPGFRTQRQCDAKRGDCSGNIQCCCSHGGSLLLEIKCKQTASPQASISQEVWAAVQRGATL